MKVHILIALTGAITTVLATPQFDINNNQPMPYSFAYGVSSPDTGDEKEHKETVSPSGITEGEYRWLQPNGLYRVTRYTADDASGFRAVVSEEPGERIGNFYTNSLLGGSVEVPSVFPSRGNQQSSSSFQLGNQQSSSSFQSGNQQSFSSFNSGNQVVATSQNFQNQGTNRGQTTQITNLGTTQNQGFTNSVDVRGQSLSILPVQSLNTALNTQPQQFTTITTSQTSQNSGDIIDGGIIDGGIINGGIIDSGVVGTTSTSFDSGLNNLNSNANTLSAGSSISALSTGSRLNTLNRQNSNINTFRSGSSLNSFGSRANNFGSTSTNIRLNSNRLGNSRTSGSTIIRAIPVVLASGQTQFRG